MPSANLRGIALAGNFTVGGMDEQRRVEDSLFLTGLSSDRFSDCIFDNDSKSFFLSLV